MNIVDRFMERCYVNFVDEVVFVYREVLGKGDPQIWSLQTARNYIKHLEGKLYDGE